MNDTWKAIITISGFAEGYNIEDGDGEFMGACFAIPTELGTGIRTGDEVVIHLEGSLITSEFLEKEYDINENLIIVRTIINNIEK